MIAFSLRRHSAAVLVALGAAGAGCHEPREARALPPSPHAAAPPSQAEAEVSRGTSPGAFRTIHLRAVPARVSLPEPSSWRAAREGSFVILEQRTTSSRIVFRVWKAGRLVRPAECEAEARLLRPALPRIDPTTLLDQRSIDAPRGYDVRLVVGVQEGPDRSVHGFALAVGAAVGRCYLGAYETRAGGPSAAERVADRLATMVPGFIETVEIEGAEVRGNRTDGTDGTP